MIPKSMSPEIRALLGIALHLCEVVVLAVRTGLGITRERDFFIDNLLVRIHFFVEMIWWTGLAPWEFEFPFPDSPCLSSEYALPIRAYS